MQKERLYGEFAWLGLHPWMGDKVVPKFTHTESSGQLPGSQLNFVQ